MHKSVVSNEEEEEEEEEEGHLSHSYSSVLGCSLRNARKASLIHIIPVQKAHFGS